MKVILGKKYKFRLYSGESHAVAWDEKALIEFRVYDTKARSLRSKFNCWGRKVDFTCRVVGYDLQYDASGCLYGNLTVNEIKIDKIYS